MITTCCPRQMLLQLRALCIPLVAIGGRYVKRMHYEAVQHHRRQQRLLESVPAAMIMIIPSP